MLTERELWQALTCATESRRAREHGHVPGSVDWINETICALDNELEDLARTRKVQEGDSPSSKNDETPLWLTSREVSALLGWPMRTVQHHADELGAVRNGGRLFFLASAVREHIEGARA
jgi:hypothetical protein